MIAGFDPAVADNGGGIVNGAGAVDETDDGGQPTAVRGDTFQSFQILVDKLWFQEHIFGRVAADGEFGENQQVGVQAAGFVHTGDYLFAITGEVAHDGVYLGKGDTQQPHVFYLLADTFIRLCPLS